MINPDAEVDRLRHTLMQEGYDLADADLICDAASDDINELMLDIAANAITEATEYAAQIGAEDFIDDIDVIPSGGIFIVTTRSKRTDYSEPERKMLLDLIKNGENAADGSKYKVIPITKTEKLNIPANMFELHFNMSMKPMDDIRVRQALCHAINRQDLINFLGKDVAQPEYSPLATGYVGHTDDVARYPYDPEKAKKLLAEAGYPDGFFLSIVTSNNVIYLPPMQVIQEQWKKVGVKLELKVVDHPTYHKLIRQNLNPVVIYGAYRYPLTGNVYLTQFYHSDSIVGKPTAVVNFSHYGEAIPGVDKLLDDARFELDVNKQKKLWIQAQQQIKRDAVSFPLFTRAYTMAKAKYLDLGFQQKSRSIYDFFHRARILAH